MANAELIKALRCCIVDFNSTQSRRCNECPYRIYADGKKACENKAKRDAADALEAVEKRIAELIEAVANRDRLADDLNKYIGKLEAQMPKEGEWIIKPHGTYGQLRAFCSACGKHSGIGGIVSNQKKPYCPNCGAKMKGENDADN